APPGPCRRPPRRRNRSQRMRVPTRTRARGRDQAARLNISLLSRKELRLLAVAQPLLNRAFPIPNPGADLGFWRPGAFGIPALQRARIDVQLLAEIERTEERREQAAGAFDFARREASQLGADAVRLFRSSHARII